MKQSALLFLLLPLTAFAQKERFTYQPRRLQTSIRTGIFNSNLNAEFRINAKTTASVDIGIGITYIHSNYYNRYNENYAEYNKYFDNSFNLGEAWGSLHTAIQIRRITSSRSHIKYTAAPYANTFNYYALQLKRNGRELPGITDRNTQFPFRETYQFALLFGRQVQLNKRGTLLFDFYFGLGALSNYRLTQYSPKWVMGTRLGLNLWGTKD